MTTLICAVPMWNCDSAWLDRVLDDLFEAILFEEQTGFITRVALVQFDKNGLPIYSKLPDDEIAYIEFVAAGMTAGVTG